MYPAVVSEVDELMWLWMFNIDCIACGDQGDVEGSLTDFNQVYETAPNMRPYLWQRGLSLYYMGQYSEGSRQFREDVAANPNDSEEVGWRSVSQF